MLVPNRSASHALSLLLFATLAGCGSDPVQGFFGSPIDLDGSATDTAGPDAGDDDVTGEDGIEDDTTEVDVQIDVFLDTDNPDAPGPDIGTPDTDNPDAPLIDGGEPDIDGPDADIDIDTTPSAETICDDGLDDDNDGRIDCNDLDCRGTPECTFENCVNGVDDDGDGDIDCADDECALTDVCIDGVEICTNVVDDDGDELVDCDDPDCFSDFACIDPLSEQCFNGVDDDGDRLIDCFDPDCILQCGGEGACTNDEDAAILGDIDLTALAFSCGLGCFADPDPASCAAECVEADTGLSSGCSDCAGDVVSCGSTTCLFDCIGGADSPTCIGCIADNCAAGFEECAGVDFPE
ncbi:MAG: hypothetical protein ACJA1R_000081 [Flavobacteriales bacterium]|jgi:hypothetical protein